ncbi:hypothetical protein BWI17_11705 [Betaproteobacteria bacterium GR16-43]|nr:hypothetical protein BWI17_11705 [Betaproteobacteria bacterium GR16-43]
MPIRTLVALAIAGLLAGCATHFVNVPLPDGEGNPERRSIDVSDKSRPVIVVALSGGGSRAAALGWNVLKELRGVKYSKPGAERRLIDDVAVVSSVSGGSTIAAFYGLNGPDALDQFEPFLVKDNVKSLLAAAANPFAWIDHAIHGGSRTDFVVDMMNAELFHGRTMAELNQPGKPFVILNGTDMAGGEVFSFRPGMFDDICAKLDTLPVAIAAATSADVPIIFAPEAYRNYSETHCKGRPIPTWITNKLTQKTGPYINLPEYRRARYANDLRWGPDPFRKIQYLYLVDGGLADNLGIHSVLDTIESPHDPARMLMHINNGNINNLVVVVVNARSDPVESEYTSPDRPGIFSMIDSVTGVPINSTTASVNAQLDVLLAQLKAAAQIDRPDAPFKNLRVYGILVDFDQLRPSIPEQKKLRDRAKAIPTSWTISAEDRAVLKEAAEVLMHQHPCFQRLLLDLNVKAPYIDPVFAKGGCPQP